MIESFFTLLGALLLVVIIIFLSYLASKYLAKGATKLGGAKHMKVIDRIVVGQDRALLIVQIGNSLYLIGSSDQSITLLKELDLAELVSASLQEMAEAQDNPDFRDSFRTVLRDRVSKRS